MANPDTVDTVELEPVQPARQLPDRTNLWRACVRWQIQRGNDTAVELLLALDPWKP